MQHIAIATVLVTWCVIVWCCFFCIGIVSVFAAIVPKTQCLHLMLLVVMIMNMNFEAGKNFLNKFLFLSDCQQILVPVQVNVASML